MIEKLDEYQQAAKPFGHYPGQGTPTGRTYCALALAGEAGEVANAQKKFLRGDYRNAPPEHVKMRERDMTDELGDCLWYIAQLANELGYTLSEIASANIEKLSRRYSPGGEYEKRKQGDG